MAGRPRKIKVGDEGEILLKNVPDADRIQKAIEDIIDGKQPAVEATKVEAPVKDEAITVAELLIPEQELPNMTETAFGLYKNKDGFFAVAEVKYDPETNQAYVSSKFNVSREKYIAVNHLKIQVGSLF